MDKEEIKSDVSFMNVIGIIIIAVGALGALGILLSFDWDTYNNYKDSAIIYEDELALMQPQMINIMVMAGASVLVSTAIGSFFIAVDKIALNIKKIQLGVKE